MLRGAHGRQWDESRQQWVQRSDGSSRGVWHLLRAAVQGEDTTRGDGEDSEGAARSRCELSTLAAAFERDLRPMGEPTQHELRPIGRSDSFEKMEIVPSSELPDV